MVSPNFGSFNFVNVKPKRVRKYLISLAHAAAEVKRKGVSVRIEVEDPRFMQIRKSEERFQKQVGERIDLIEKRISKSLYRMNKQVHNEQKRLREKLYALRHKEQISKARVTRKTKTLPLVTHEEYVTERKLPESKEVVAMEKRLLHVDNTAEKLTEVLSIKKKVHILEERINWLHKRGFDSAVVHELEHRLYHVKNVLFGKISALLSMMHGKKNSKDL